MPFNPFITRITLNCPQCNDLAGSRRRAGVAVTSLICASTSPNTFYSTSSSSLPWPSKGHWTWSFSADQPASGLPLTLHEDPPRPPSSHQLPLQSCLEHGHHGLRDGPPDRPDTGEELPVEAAAGLLPGEKNRQPRPPPSPLPSSSCSSHPASSTSSLPPKATDAGLCHATCNSSSSLVVLQKCSGEV